MAIWQSQPKAIELRSAKKPCTKGSLSGVAIYRDVYTSYPFYIDYLGTTDRSLARKMPMGIGPAHPAYLLVIYLEGTYRIWCSYVNEDFKVHLWTQIEPPKWLTPQ